MFGWLRKQRSRARLQEEVGLWYHSDYAPGALAESSRIPNIEPHRGELVIAALARHGLLQHGDIRAAPLASFDQLVGFHTTGYVQASAHPEALAHVFGMDPAEIEVDELVRAQRLAVGGTIAAALACVEGPRPLKVGFNLGGGLHHAEPDRGSGFCIYNDIGAAISVLRGRGFDRKVAIVDLDFHQGNGNQLGFAHDPSVFTYSVQGSIWSHFEPPVGREITLPPATGDATYLEAMDGTLEADLREQKPELVFFIAGTDVLAGDRLGTFKLSPGGVLERDRRVVDLARALGVPLVVTMGGGYSRGAWQSTANLLRYVLTDDTRPKVDHSPSLRAHYRRIAQEIDPRHLTNGTHSLDLVLTEEDLISGLTPRAPARKLLDYYSRQGVEYALEVYGIQSKVRARGYTDVEVSMDVGDRDHQMVRSHATHLASGRRHLLVEMVLARKHLRLPADPEAEEVRVLSVEWLMLQDPEAQFTLERPRLPGQEHPGLGIAEEIQELLIQACHRVGLDGLYDRPAHWHNALATAAHFRFLAPEDEGRFRAMAAVLSSLGVKDATEAVEARALLLEDGSVFPYEPRDHVLAVSPRLRQYLESEAYVSRMQEERERVLMAGLHLSPALRARN